jgi:steroid delta-isomerase-like uncharacterized protein
MNNETIVIEFIQKVWNEKDFDSVIKYVAPAYTVYRDNADPWEGKTLDLEVFKTRLMYSFNSFPNMNFDIKATIADGDHVAIMWIMTGTNSGKIGEYPPTNRKIEAEGMTFYHVKDGKLCGHTQVFDRTTIMKQLGFLR